MSTDGGDKDDDLLEGIYEATAPTLTDEDERPFRPWHKPRKHFLRVKQWCRTVRDLIREVGYSPGAIVKYVGLPADDFLDIRTLHGVCERESVQLHYLGFDSTADTGGEYEMNLSKHEVSGLAFVHPLSVVVRDRIEHVAISMSVAQNVFEKHGPFDVVNLDICDSVAGISGLGSYFDAIRQVCDLQLKGGRNKPWLLFLATRAIRSQLDSASKAELLTCVRENARSYPSFAEVMKTALELEEDALTKEILNEAELDHPALVKAFGLGFGKWLLNLAMSAAPQMRVRLLPSYSYRIEIAEPDMLSLAFKFEPVIQPRKDRSGLAPGTTQTLPNVTEMDLALEMVSAIAGIEDVDRLLADDAELLSKTIDKCGDVLASARYDKDKYSVWARQTHTFGSASRPDKGRL